ncbi:hypothetical protein MHY85_16565 [Cellulomonas sp. ACRRI]|uniref:hypothetical protein n=1 Tax=Cellulomonas sp. ACRRI TaxID=2918188 RepID=UPI001EF3199B|nr:hypothetical protein [Cellulomonas sp. ACRRI]MCG7287580.1 hypothetical protein [Cellulomonas sp. ACRRI]
MMRTRRPLLLVAVCSVALASCTASPPQGPDPTPVVQDTPTASPVPEPVEEDPGTTTASDGSVPAWAGGLSRAGESVGEVVVDGLHVDLRYLDTFPADRAQEVSASDGNFTLYAAGDPIHHLNVVVTNETDETIVLGGGMAVDLFPDGWDYLNAPVGPTIPWDYKDEVGLVASAIKEIADDYRYPFAPGESFSFTISTHADSVEARVVWRDPGNWVDQHEGAVPLSFV